MSFIRKHHRVTAAALCLVAACTPESLVKVPVPSGVVEPGTVASPAGALQLYNIAVTDFATSYGGGLPQDRWGGGTYIGMTGILTDELQTRMHNTNSPGLNGYIDERNASSGLPGTTDSRLYHMLQHSRVILGQARQALELYAPNQPADLRGQVLALEAYSIVWLAEAFCSGIPLTTVPLVGSQQPTAGLTTQEMFEIAVAKFDTAIGLATDSTRIRNLAKVGKARALLSLGRYADAAAAVQGIPTDFTYAIRYSSVGTPQQSGLLVLGNALATNPRIVQVVDNEGTNGLPWSTDPRTGVRTTSSTGAMRVPAKYAITPAGAIDPNGSYPTAPLRLADGLEARLIEAEADLAAGGSTWLTTLNALRSSCIGTTPCAPVPDLDGSSLPALADPGSASGRVDLLMRERAMWLYVTGHRLGDLRRMARVYGRDPESVFPTGTYLNPGFPEVAGSVSPMNGTPYGKDVVFMPPADEKTNNAMYGGCFDVQP